MYSTILKRVANLLLVASLSLPGIVVAGEAAHTEQPGKNKSSNCGPGTGLQTNGDLGRMCAIVNGNPIFDQDVSAEYFRSLAVSGKLLAPVEKQRRTELRKQALERLIERKVVLSMVAKELKDKPQEAEKLRALGEAEGSEQLRKIRKQLNTDKNLEDLLVNNGTTCALVRKHIEDDFVVHEVVRCLMVADPSFVSARAIREYYEYHPNEFTAGTVRKPLDDETKKEITAKLIDAEYEHIIRGLIETSIIQRLPCEGQ